ncbi:hypothetical protein FZC76_21790 [Sutcliffiella horikoshii]|uniref:Uncharacterized protein n=1 Tax=Sutcliffiella horikoshii TaxID=79883 RepID=A0A5D4SA40_9BACI|nr:hypothetical protein [Sutcliffiella horikoshii]TYS60505.1 hypothetical protein FZC76_21790 [Sutcliffiella horikoshii]
MMVKKQKTKGYNRRQLDKQLDKSKRNLTKAVKKQEMIQRKGVQKKVSSETTSQLTQMGEELRESMEISDQYKRMWKAERLTVMSQHKQMEALEERAGKRYREGLYLGFVGSAAVVCIIYVLSILLTGGFSV